MERRFERSRKRARPGDPTRIEEFLEREQQENSGDAAEQRIDATFRLADRVTVNDGDLEALQRLIDGLVSELTAPAGLR